MLCVLASLAAADLGSAQVPPKQEPPKSLPEYELKAGFLFQFAKYVTWPANAFADDKSPIVIGIVGDDPFGEHLARLLKDKTIKGRPFEMQRFAKPEDVKDCHMLFVPKSQRTRVPKILEAAAKMAALTIGEDAEFARDGGGIAILVQDEKVKLEVNLDVTRQAGLGIDAKLLKVATVLKKEK